MRSTPARTLQLIVGLLLILMPLGTTFAKGDLELKPENLRISDNSIVHLQTVKIYATVNNNSNKDLYGSVQFKNATTGNNIGSDQPISVLAGGTDSVFVEWKPPAGTYTITATVIPWDTTDDSPTNNQAKLTTIVDYDFDGDGIGNAQDKDDDNDGTPDEEDAFPLDPLESKDTDGDGIGDNADLDDDNDGTPDTEDQMPLDPLEILDTDGDGIGDNADLDDDGDGLSDEQEAAGITQKSTSETTNNPTNNKPVLTNPKKADTDGDGVNDAEDAFPTNPKEWEDTDGDGIGNNQDTDDDNDELPDTKDPFPLNKGPVAVIKNYTSKEKKKLTGETVEAGIKYQVWDASLSYDPNGNPIAYRWFSKDGRLIGTEAILKLRVGLNNILPASLIITNDLGEERVIDLSTLSKKYFGAMGLALLFCLLIALALILYLKYNPTASKAKSPQKSTKTSPKR